MRKPISKKTPCKESKAGRLAVDADTLKCVNESTFDGKNLLEVVYRNGLLLKDYKFKDIRR